MKKTLLFGGIALLLSMTACDSNNSKTTQKFSVPVYNVLTSLTDGTTSISPAYYTFDLITSSMVGTISEEGLIIDNSAVNFITDEVKYKSYTLNDALFSNIEATTTGTMTYALTNGTFNLNPYFYVPNKQYTPATPYALIASYNLGSEYKVVTYFIDPYYVGDTNTQYTIQGTQQRYKTDNIVYGVKLNLKEMTATISMYNAKFTDVPQEPTKAQINIAGLPLTFSNGAIIIKGENIVPTVVEGGVETPYEDFMINSIEFRSTSSNLVSASINYVVAGMYYGSFTGDYATLEYMK